MKKIILIFILILFIERVDALSKFYLGEKVNNMYIEESRGDNFHNGAPFILIRDDGYFVYCIDPFSMMDTNNYYDEYSYFDLNISEDIINKVNIISYFGYGYNNHTDIKWYGITQYLIWKTIGMDQIYFTDSYYGNKIDMYVDEVLELENLVNEYYKLPSFANETFEYVKQKEYKLEDLNNVINNYEILDANIDVSINDSNLIINTLEDGEYEIKFIKKSPVDNDYILYGLNGAQPLIYPGRIKDIEFSIFINVYSGEITINKIDSENKERNSAKLGGAKYGLYNDLGLIETYETNNDGIINIELLSLGKYYIKELEPSYGYELDNNIYFINLTKDSKTSVVYSYENVIKVDVEINKYYVDDEDYKESDAVFEIYDDKDNFVNVYKTNEDGIINLKLEYGNYYLKQIKGKVGYRLIDKFLFKINDTSKKTYNLYNEVLIVSVPNTGVYIKKNYIYLYLIFIGISITIIGIIKKATDL